MEVEVEGHTSKCTCELCGDIRAILGKDPVGAGYYTKWKGSEPLIRVSNSSRPSADVIVYQSPRYSVPIIEEQGMPPWSSRIANRILLGILRTWRKAVTTLYGPE